MTFFEEVLTTFNTMKRGGTTYTGVIYNDNVSGTNTSSTFRHKLGGVKITVSLDVASKKISSVGYKLELSNNYRETDFNTVISLVTEQVYNDPLDVVGIQ